MHNKQRLMKEGRKEGSKEGRAYYYYFEIPYSTTIV